MKKSLQSFPGAPQVPVEAAVQAQLGSGQKPEQRDLCRPLRSPPGGPCPCRAPQTPAGRSGMSVYSIPTPNPSRKVRNVNLSLNYPKPQQEDQECQFIPYLPQTPAEISAMLLDQVLFWLRNGATERHFKNSIFSLIWRVRQCRCYMLHKPSIKFKNFSTTVFPTECQFVQGPPQTPAGRSLHSCLFLLGCELLRDSRQGWKHPAQECLGLEGTFWGHPVQPGPPRGGGPKLFPLWPFRPPPGNACTASQGSLPRG